MLQHTHIQMKGDTLFVCTLCDIKTTVCDAIKGTLDHRLYISNV